MNRQAKTLGAGVAPMNALDAERALAGVELVSAAEGGLGEIKRLVERCLDAGVPALLGAEACAKPGCTPKAQALVRADDAPRVSQLLSQEWMESLEREGAMDGELIARLQATSPAEGDPPCPACGTVAPLVEGACSDCGLQLE